MANAAGGVVGLARRRQWLRRLREGRVAGARLAAATTTTATGGPRSAAATASRTAGGVHGRAVLGGGDGNSDCGAVQWTDATPGWRAAAGWARRARNGLDGPIPLFCFFVPLTEVVVQPPLKIPHFQRRLLKGGYL